MERLATLLSDNVLLEDIAGILCTWQFHAIFSAFNISIFLTISFKYGIFITFASVDHSCYSVLYALVSRG